MKKVAMVCLFSLMAGLGTGIAIAAPNVPFNEQMLLKLKQQGKELLDKKDYKNAFLVYEELARFSPVDPEVNKGLAWSATAIGRYTHAILAYERLLALEPENVKYHLQLARVYAYLGDTGTAQSEINKARQYNPNISQEIERKILTSFNSRRNAGSKPVKNYFARGQVAIGGIYDTNANQGPNSNTLTLGAFENLIFTGVKKQSSWASYTNMRFEGGHKIMSSPNWWLAGDLGVHQRWNYSSTMDSNNGFLLGRAAAGIMYLNHDVMIDVRFKGERARQFHKESKEQNIVSHGPELSLSYNLAPQWLAITNANYEKRSYEDPDYYSGKSWAFGEYIQKSFDNDVFVLLGARGFKTLTKDEPLGHKGWEVMNRISFDLTNDIKVSPFVVYQNRKYHGAATALETETRRDKQWRFGVTTSLELTNNLGIETGYQYIKNNSNSELYKYNQHMVNAGVVWQF